MYTHTGRVAVLRTRDKRPEGALAPHTTGMRACERVLAGLFIHDGHVSPSSLMSLRTLLQQLLGARRRWLAPAKSGVTGLEGTNGRFASVCT